MLVLSRKLNEKIQIGDDVSITVLEIKGNKVRIGIQAPQQVRVVRSELPPKQPSPQPTPAAVAADVSATDISFVPIRQTALHQQQRHQPNVAESRGSSQTRLQAIRHAANWRNQVASQLDVRH